VWQKPPAPILSRTYITLSETFSALLRIQLRTYLVWFDFGLRHFGDLEWGIELLDLYGFHFDVKEAAKTLYVGGK
jgi:hypothetical protein